MTAVEQFFKDLCDLGFIEYPDDSLIQDRYNIALEMEKEQIMQAYKFNATGEPLKNAEKELRISNIMCSLPTDEFLSKHLYKTHALLKFGITEMIHKKDLSRTELIGVLEYITNLR